MSTCVFDFPGSGVVTLDLTNLFSGMELNLIGSSSGTEMYSLSNFMSITLDSQSNAQHSEIINTNYLLNCTPKGGGVEPIKEPYAVPRKCVVIFPELGKKTLSLTDSWQDLKGKLEHKWTTKRFLNS